MERTRFLGTFGIIREAVRIGIRNPSLISLVTIFSLLLFCISLLHELLLHQILKEAIAVSLELVRKLPPNSGSLAVTRSAHMTSMSGRVLLLDLLYLIPIPLLNLLTAITTSANYAGARPLGLQDMLHDSITKTRWKGPLVTYIYKFLFSSISLIIVAFFILLGPLLLSRNVMLLLVSMMGAIIALGIWLVLSAWWNMGGVVSILEDKGGVQALSTSKYLSKGNRVRGFVLILLNFIWLYGLSWPTLHGRGSFCRRVVLVFVNTGLVCVGKVMNWVVCMVYYHDCRRCCRDKVDMEEGRQNELLIKSKDYVLNSSSPNMGF